MIWERNRKACGILNNKTNVYIFKFFKQIIDNVDHVERKRTV